MKKNTQNLAFKLNTIKQYSKGIDAEIAHYLIDSIAKEKKIGKIVSLARKLNTSTSTITRFSKKVGISFPVLRYSINNYKIKDRVIDTNFRDNDLKKVATILKKANKIYFWGISGAGLINEDFNRKLLRLNLNTVCVNNIEDQVGISRLAKTKDVLFITSFYGNHDAYLRNIESNKAYKILLSSSKEVNLLSKYCDIVLETLDHSDLEQTTSIRLVTRNERTNAFIIIDKIMDELLKNKDLYSKNTKSRF